MRALLVSPKFPLSFWSFPKSSRLRGAKSPIPPLGLITVAALLPDDWDLRLVDLNVKPVREEDWRWADMLMISAMYIQKGGLTAVTREAKRRGKTVVAGGPYPTSLPEEALQAGSDFVVRGEAENTISLLLKAIEDGGPAVIENTERPNITASPIPRFDLLNFADYNSLAIQTSRGCPFDCEFCDVVSLFGRTPRHKTPEQVIGELETLEGLGADAEVFICDDNFIGGKKHAKALLNLLIPWREPRGKPFSFFAQVSVNLARDLELIDLMTEASVGDVFVGLESPDEDVLRSSRKLHNVVDPLAESIDTLTRNGMTVIGSFIIGLDGEKKGVDRRISALVESPSMPMVMLGLLQAPPGTSLWRRLESEGRPLHRDRPTASDSMLGAIHASPRRPITRWLSSLR